MLDRTAALIETGDLPAEAIHILGEEQAQLSAMLAARARDATAG